VVFLSAGGEAGGGAAVLLASALFTGCVAIMVLFQVRPRVITAFTTVKSRATLVPILPNGQRLDPFEFRSQETMKRERSHKLEPTLFTLSACSFEASLFVISISRIRLA
jgi:hypothetical protein